MSTTALIQRTTAAVASAAKSTVPSSPTRGSANTPSSPITSPASSVLATATSVLPVLNLTPQKTTTTPVPSTPQQSQSPPVSAPGQWQHPRMQEIIRRQNAMRFGPSNLRIVGLNAGLFAASILVPMVGATILPSQLLIAGEPYNTYILWLLRVIFMINIGIASTPLFLPADTCEDVPLTPSQRKLLGLPPMSRAATPQEQGQYVTPPRYSRSATPQSATSSIRGNASDSPLSGRGSPFNDSSLRHSVSGSTRPSPLGAHCRHGSHGRGSPLSTPEFDAAGNLPTPTRNSKASVPLNSKWLYDKGRASPRTSFNSLGGFGGGGSVFQ